MFGVCHHQEPTYRRTSYGDESLFADRMILIGKRASQRITEHSGSLVEGYAMLAQIGLSLLCVPSELHSIQLLS